MPKPKFDKSKYSKGGKEQHPVKVVSTKRPITKPPAKDKAVLNSVRCASEGPGVCVRQGTRGRRPDSFPARLSLLPRGAGTLALLCCCAVLVPGFVHSETQCSILPISVVKSGPCRLESRPV